MHGYTLSAIRLFSWFCKMFSEISTIVMQLPCCPGKQGELSKYYLQNLRNDLMADSVHTQKTYYFASVRCRPRRLALGLVSFVVINLILIGAIHGWSIIKLVNNFSRLRQETSLSGKASVAKFGLSKKWCLWMRGAIFLNKATKNLCSGAFP